jgi:hypothetical protein
MAKKKHRGTKLRESELAEERHARPNLREDLARQLDAFRKKFGRDPAPGDPLFFDPERDEPTPMSADEQAGMVADLIEAMVRIGRPELAYAFARSGYLVSAENKALIPEDGLREWQGAIVEWSEMSAADRATATQGLVSRRRQ